MKFDLGYINRIVVVSVFFGDAGRKYAYQLLRKKKDEIIFEKRGKGFTDIASLVKETSSKYPFVLHFEGKGIINRQAAAGENYRANLLMNNSGEDDFYFTEYKDGQILYFSFTRRDLLDEMAEEFAEEGAKVIAVSSGPFTPGYIASYLDRKELKVYGYELKLSDAGIIELNKSTDGRFGTIGLGSDHFDSWMLPSLAAGAHYFNPSGQLNVPGRNGLFEANLSEAKQKNIFRRFTAAMVVFFSIVLIGNYFYLNSLNRSIEDNYGRLSDYEGQLAQLSQLKEEKDRKEILLRSSGLLSRNFLSFYLMELGNSVPRDITFDEIKDRQKIEFMDKLILLNGRSKTSHILQQWIEKLETKEWIASVEIMNYTYTKNKGNFELQILLN